MSIGQPIYQNYDYEEDILRDLKALNLERKKEVVDFVSYLAASQRREEIVRRMNMLEENITEKTTVKMTEDEILDEIDKYRSGQ